MYQLVVKVGMEEMEVLVEVELEVLHLHEGSGNTHSVTPSQGNRGGNYGSNLPITLHGGGGAGATGFDKPGGICGLTGGPGGSLGATAINGTTTGFAGGGGGGAGICGCASNNVQFPNGRAAARGTGQADTLGFGGATGGRNQAFGGGAGTDNTGGGGGEVPEILLLDLYKLEVLAVLV